MVALPVLNNGNLPIPYFVESVRNPALGLEGNPGNRHTRRNLMQAETARQVHDIMIVAVDEGSGRAAKVSGATVGGKTGTAQLGGSDQPHAWFMGFAEEGDRSVVIAVLVENAGGGAQVAAPVFAQVAQAALRDLGEPVEEIFPDPPPPAPRPGEITLQAALPEPAPEVQSPQLLPPDLPRDESKIDFIAHGPGSCQDLPAVAASAGAFGWPSNYHTLSGGDFVQGHPGIDLAAPSGSAVFAADAGLVIFAAWTDVGYGNTIVIDHGNGYRTLYAHLSQLSTACGAIIEAGQVIGLSGSTGNSLGPHLHFEVRVPDGFVDPKKALPVE
jgi:murein DD-endopeptidase MepM/ murein hydrolase activator NlpD